jgi:bifunctional oligoribonuclease and PAP phosphatase NrnA
MSADPYRSLVSVLSIETHVLVATHVKPDGDAIGTAVAMILGLRKKGIESRFLLFDPPPAKYSFLLMENKIDWFSIAKVWPPDARLENFDAFLCVDTGTWSQLPGLQEKFAGWKVPKLVLDHHLTQEDWADAKLVVTEAAAAGEIAAELFKRWKVEIDLPMATALYLAIATDTGWFQFANTRPATLHLAAELLELGVDADRLYQVANQNERPQRLALMARALGSLEYLAGGRLAVMSLSKEDFALAGADGSDTENLINIPMQVGAVQASMLICEEPAGNKLRVSLRSKGGIDVAAFAQNYKGGGHARASGLKMETDIASGRKVLSEALTAELTRPA